MEFLTLIIPVFFVSILFIKFREKTAIWEYVLPIAVSLVSILFFKMIAINSAIKDEEYLSDYITEVRYYEDWDEWIEQTCTRSYPCGTDANGNTEYCTETYDCSYSQYYPPYWLAICSAGSEHMITERMYKDLKKKWGNSQFVDLGRDYYRDDGDLHVTYFNNDLNKIRPVTWIQQYDNYIQASQSIYKFTEPDTSYKLLRYPVVHDMSVNSIIAEDYNLPGMKDAMWNLNKYNAMMGPVKQIRMWLLIYKNKPMNYGFAQEQKWMGGNKNELITVLGISDSLDIDWVHVFSWTDSVKSKILIRDQISEMDSLNLVKVVDIIKNNAEEHFRRKEFADFNYLTVELSSGQLMALFIIIMAVSLGTFLFVIFNEIDADDSWYHKRYGF